MVRHSRGFTLLEVLVALAVLALAMSALLSSGSANLSGSAYLRDRTLAQWLALNKVTELRLQPEWPAIGRGRGSEEMANREWFWRSEVSTTFDDGVRRLEVSVYADEGAEEERLAHVTAFLPQPLPQVSGQ